MNENFLLLDKLVERNIPAHPHCMPCNIFLRRGGKVQCHGKFNATQRRDFSFSRMTN